MGRILHTTTLVLAAFALLVPTALAQRPDDRAGMLGVGAAAATTSVTRPDDRAESRGPGALAPQLGTATRPDDRGGLRGPGAVPIGVMTPATDGFDWVDAGVGAVGAFGLALILFGMLALTTRTRRSHVAV